MIKILIIDDDAAVRRMTEKLLKRIGYGVLTSCDGESGLAIFKETVVDIVILDFNMPGITGLKVFEKIRELSKEVFVIILTGNDISEKIINNDNLTCIVSKGDGVEVLLDKIRELIKK